ncbi:peptidoglycan-associated lipoprotein Pal [Thalassovita sp.]|uniref:peptidoglycan-associated lipoprotein Pal n=1 Tax=Thalassovita sp. TaxID=1979401 RepID=UPI0028817682|nr:peptidoglycan-associated lipoprotein Pal [Thalassovita sp.]MDF1803331.1 peptidoglycan-associated lipoprotein Pal [Thalassovita sp.]
MKHITRAVLLTSVLALAACSTPDRFSGDEVNLGGVGDPGSPSDPTSPAFFQETVGDRVFFTVDQSNLGGEAQVTLDGQAQWLLTNTDYTAIIEGHADEQGTREYNLALGARRANAVQEYLVQQGVPSSRLRVVSYGKERPIEICSQEACYAKNRRAVTIISADYNS